VVIFTFNANFLKLLQLFISVLLANEVKKANL